MCLVRGEIDRESLRVRIYENDPYWVNPRKRGPNTGHVDLGIRPGGDDSTSPIEQQLTLLWKAFRPISLIRAEQGVNPRHSEHAVRIYAPCDVKLSVVAGSDIPDAAEIGMLNNKFQVEVARLKGQQSSGVGDCKYLVESVRVCYGLDLTVWIEGFRTLLHNVSFSITNLDKVA